MTRREQLIEKMASAAPPPLGVASAIMGALRAGSLSAGEVAELRDYYGLKPKKGLKNRSAARGFLGGSLGAADGGFLGGLYSPRVALAGALGGSVTGALTATDKYSRKGVERMRQQKLQDKEWNARYNGDATDVGQKVASMAVQEGYAYEMSEIEKEAAGKAVHEKPVGMFAQARADRMAKKGLTPVEIAAKVRPAAKMQPAAPKESIVRQAKNVMKTKREARPLIENVTRKTIRHSAHAPAAVSPMTLARLLKSPKVRIGAGVAGVGALGTAGYMALRKNPQGE
jgi:hypothetical protein